MHSYSTDFQVIVCPKNIAINIVPRTYQGIVTLSLDFDVITSLQSCSVVEALKMNGTHRKAVSASNKWTTHKRT